MKEVYKVKHIPSGLYIQPSRDSNCHSNIGKRGKVYEGNNIWQRIQNGNEYHFLEVHEGYTPYKELSNKFPELIKKSICHHDNCVEFITKPSDFIKEYIPTITQKKTSGVLKGLIDNIDVKSLKLTKMSMLSVNERAKQFAISISPYKQDKGETWDIDTEKGYIKGATDQRRIDCIDFSELIYELMDENLIDVHDIEAVQRKIKERYDNNGTTK